MEAQKRLGQMIREARLKKGIKQLYVSLELGYRYSDVISEIELGKRVPQMSHLPKLCQILELPKEHLESAYSRVFEEKMRLGV